MGKTFFAYHTVEREKFAVLWECYRDDKEKMG